MKRINKLLAFLLVISSLVTLTPQVSYADTTEIVTLGADLSDEQKDTVLSFFGLTDEDLSNKCVITVNNQDERKYLEGILSDNIIGTKTYSCAYFQPTESGGINVKTANLTYVTKNTLYNALQTAGIENCNLIVTAPFQVSGTGALTGVFMAFESTGNELNEDKKELASKELVETAELEKEYGEEVTNLVSDVKEEVIETPEELTDEDIKSIILEKAKDYNITLKEEDTNKIVEITNKLQKLEYDVNAFTSQLKKTESALEGAGQEISNASKKATGFFGKIKQFFVNIINWFKNLFSSKNVTNDVDNTEKVDTTESSIFDNVDTDVFKFDGEEETESNIETVEETESISTDTESSDNSNTELEDNVEIERY